MQIILASQSPRRRELLAQITDFQVEPSLFEESAKGLSARDTALCFACGKAREVASRFPSAVVLGADTVVALGDEILGKPKSKEDAKRMLRALSGREHTVYTGVCIVGGGRERTEVVASRVYFNGLDDGLIGRYIESGLPLDKAGAYGIQDGYPLVERYEGSYTNIIGLPVETVRELLKEFLK